MAMREQTSAFWKRGVCRAESLPDTRLDGRAMTLAILMPAHNEGARLQRTLESLRDSAEELGGVTVFLVDDGSVPSVRRAGLPAASANFEIVFTRHAINLGQGAALETARQLALREREFTAYVTMDSDGQHCVEGAKHLAQSIAAGADVAFGNRFVPGSRIPTGRRLLLRAARLFERVLTGLSLSDAHNGLRGFSRRALLGIRIRHDRMAHATEITRCVSRSPSWVVAEVPVNVRYSGETLAKGQNAAGALTILVDLVSHYFFQDPV